MQEQDFSFTQNRELSWLRFNERVLQASCGRGAPLFERLRFFSIFAGNLDEFYMVRVGRLLDLSLMRPEPLDDKTGLTPKEQLAHIHKACAALYEARDKTFAALCRQMDKAELRRLRPQELGAAEQKLLEKHFRHKILPVLSPVLIGDGHPFPHLEDRALYIAAALRDKQGSAMGLVPLPALLPPLVPLPGKSLRFVLPEELILFHVKQAFPRHEITERCVLRVTRGADIAGDYTDDFPRQEDVQRHMKKLLKKRGALPPVRLEVSHGTSRRMCDFFLRRLSIGKSLLFKLKSPLSLEFIPRLEEALAVDRTELFYAPHIPPVPPGLEGAPVSQIVRERDVLLCPPYESILPFLRLVKEAAGDASVRSISVTLYRIDKLSRLALYLAEAAENGKEVTVLLELRAKFDESNNLVWAKRLQEAGCRVLFGPAQCKVHSKLCLITREEAGETVFLTQIGTGNYNEKTAAQYTDLSLITADREIGEDARLFFDRLRGDDSPGEYRCLWVAPHEMKSRLLSCIRREARKGERGRIICKVNALSDREVIDSLRAASCAGVTVRLLVRGICCLLPGVPGKTENVTVKSIVGRFLEHSRVYCFGDGEDSVMYLSSADFMARNLNRRIEVACPVKDPAVLRRIEGMLSLMLSDKTAGAHLMPDGRYRCPEGEPPPPDCQEILLKGLPGEENSGFSL